jgi:membrane complex biogenesis BtpA family protein
VRLDRSVIGMVHLPPLPGSPRWAGSMERVIEAAIADARTLREGGVDALLVENYGDVPFAPVHVEPPAIAAMTVAVAEVRRAAPGLPVGVNVLRSDGRAALAVAVATGAVFIRVNVHAGAVVADQGIVQSDAYTLLRERRLIDADVRIFADVRVKHAAPLAPVELEHEARDLVHRGLADALVVSGAATGEPTALADLHQVRRAVASVPLLVGSGVTAETVADLLAVADAVIVGTSIKRGGEVTNPVDPGRVRVLVAAARTARRSGTAAFPSPHGGPG